MTSSHRSTPTRRLPDADADAEPPARRRRKNHAPSDTSPPLELAVFPPRPPRRPALLSPESAPLAFAVPALAASAGVDGDGPALASAHPAASSSPTRRLLPRDHAGPDPAAPLASFVRRIVMKARAHLFPLLRSSPAVGTGSYGALPSPGSFDGSQAGTDTEDEDADARPQSPGEQQRRRRLQRRRSRHMMTIGEGSTRIQKGLGSVGVDGAAEDGEDGAASTQDGAAIDIDNESEDDPDDPEDNSPYAEVRASVLAMDDESLSINTPRMWFLSLLFSLVGSSTNLFFSLRYPSISITPVIALLLAHPLGKVWDQAFSDEGDEEAKTTWGRIRQWLGQGRWNRKEHACVYISSNVSFGFAFATDV